MQAEYAPASIYCRDLVKRSDMLPIDHFGDLMRLKMFVAKISGVGALEVRQPLRRCAEF